MTTGRNDPCPCGSGKKFKRCCLQAGDPAKAKRRKMMWIAIAAAVVLGIVAALVFSQAVGLGVGLGALMLVGAWLWLTAPPPTTGSKGDPGAINFGR